VTPYLIVNYFILQLDLLATALMSCGRGDIASELRDKDLEYKSNMTKAHKGLYSVL
jgi:hypothetical protein